MHKHTAIVRNETHTQTKHRPSLKAAHKMPPVRQTEIQNGRQLVVCACVCVCGNRAECFVLTEKLAASQCWIHTDVE